jgi:hypothetical protein
MTIIIQSHTYTINLDNVSYFSEDRFNQTVFTTTNGRKVRITCPYDEVNKQINSALMSALANTMSTQNVPIFIELEYGVRTDDDVNMIKDGTAENIFAQIAKVQGES